MQPIDDQVNIAFLKQILAGGPLPAWYVMQEVKAERIKRGLVSTDSEDFTRTAIKRAKKKIKVQVRNEAGIIIWELPPC